VIQGSRALATALVAVLIGCAPTRPVVTYMPPPPILVSGTLVVADSAFELDFPNQWRKRNPYTDCFDRLIQSPYSFSEFCVARVHSDSLPRAMIRTDSTALPPRCIDCSFYADVRTDTIAREPHLIIRQQALLSGTIRHYGNHPVWRLIITLSRSETAVFAVSEDDRGRAKAELMTLARTLRMRRARPDGSW
jgi:hypothetical protein